MRTRFIIKPRTVAAFFSILVLMTAPFAPSLPNVLAQVQSSAAPAPTSTSKTYSQTVTDEDDIRVDIQVTTDVKYKPTREDRSTAEQIGMDLYDVNLEMDDSSDSLISRLTYFVPYSALPADFLKQLEKDPQMRQQSSPLPASSASEAEIVPVQAGAPPFVVVDGIMIRAETANIIEKGQAARAAADTLKNKIGKVPGIVKAAGEIAFQLDQLKKAFAEVEACLNSLPSDAANKELQEMWRRDAEQFKGHGDKALLTRAVITSITTTGKLVAGPASGWTLSLVLEFSEKGSKLIADEYINSALKLLQTMADTCKHYCSGVSMSDAPSFGQSYIKLPSITRASSDTGIPGQPQQPLLPPDGTPDAASKAPPCEPFAQGRYGKSPVLTNITSITFEGTGKVQSGGVSDSQTTKGTIKPMKGTSVGSKVPVWSGANFITKYGQDAAGFGTHVYDLKSESEDGTCIYQYEAPFRITTSIDVALTSKTYPKGHVEMRFSKLLPGSWDAPHVGGTSPDCPSSTSVGGAMDPMQPCPKNWRFDLSKGTPVSGGKGLSFTVNDPYTNTGDNSATCKFTLNGVILDTTTDTGPKTDPKPLGNSPSPAAPTGPTGIFPNSPTSPPTTGGTGIPTPTTPTPTPTPPLTDPTGRFPLCEPGSTDPTHLSNCIPVVPTMPITEEECVAKGHTWDSNFLECIIGCSPNSLSPDGACPAGSTTTTTAPPPLIDPGAPPAACDPITDPTCLPVVPTMPITEEECVAKGHTWDSNFLECIIGCSPNSLSPDGACPAGSTTTTTAPPPPAPPAACDPITDPTCLPMAPADHRYQQLKKYV